jgi:hypothetical protein
MDDVGRTTQHRASQVQEVKMPWNFMQVPSVRVKML